ncbi:MAG: bifunctional precorrin-2 dehydrogenase/sirohydrochlorin ferrochelatase [Proteobacteria bacterium]|nr:bifunctional precorrin-2 dehydrogenase/sirohydrochlorin ferrochelatase [Pseudomonadota bacterium]
MNSKNSKFYTKQLHYPLFLDIADKSCIVMGGGKIAERKVVMLLRFNAKVKLISPKITGALTKLSKSGKIEVIGREYKEGDLDGASLVFAATNRKEINERIKKEAAIKGILVNVVDDPGLCDFIVPSIVKKDPIVIAISSSGVLPSLSKRLKKEINKYITGDYIKYAHIIGKFRKLLIETVKDRKKREEIMAAINKTDMKELINMNMKEIITRFLKETR